MSEFHKQWSGERVAVELRVGRPVAEPIEDPHDKVVVGPIKALSTFFTFGVAQISGLL